MRNLRFRERRYKKESQIFAIKNLDFQKTFNTDNFLIKNVLTQNIKTFFIRNYLSFFS
ncbi:hypothetical protein BACPLE_00331 [Phocaeicola plebeius DSM 17135]|uniref:Uncharacterized protein n=1 Tax=Phocaeicola plebeius (strain DSM 17135 / JCM 12973 / CCUG 54634 / M2) TaxID=484018 RepID=B5CUG0_PHOPM|nr:hypothetical protein BACPLE_00331 [Phocaeicola plebeius DSM 17135]